MLDTIPGPLRDRMEVISLAGYTEDEKLEIARRYLVRRQLEANGLTRRAGRDQRRRACARSSAPTRARRACATSSARSAACCATWRCGSPRAAPSTCGSTRATSPASSARRASRTRWRCAPACPASPPASPGRRSAATSCSSRRAACPARASLILTGQLGDVMRESVAGRAHARQEPRRARSASTPALFEKNDIHMHVPAGAIPKDGPSAGVAMFIALVSLLTGPDRAQRHRDDRRDLAARPRAAGRRHQGEGRRGGRARA